MTKFERRVREWLDSGGRERTMEAAERARATSRQFGKATKPKWWTLYWPMQSASCDTRRMAETVKHGSVRGTGGAVPSEAQADAQTSSPSPPRTLKQ